MPTVHGIEFERVVRFKARLYHPDCPKGKVFTDKEEYDSYVKKGWIDVQLTDKRAADKLAAFELSQEKNKESPKDWIKATTQKQEG